MREGNCSPPLPGDTLTEPAAAPGRPAAELRGAQGLTLRPGSLGLGPAAPGQGSGQEPVPRRLPPPPGASARAAGPARPAVPPRGSSRPGRGKAAAGTGPARRRAGSAADPNRTEPRCPPAAAPLHDPLRHCRPRGGEQGNAGSAAQTPLRASVQRGPSRGGVTVPPGNLGVS